MRSFIRDSLQRIGDSDQVEVIRRKTDSLVNRQPPELKSEQGIEVDEITGEPLRIGSAFHHTNNKPIYNDPRDVIDPEQGINVNPETCRKIYRKGIIGRDQLESQKKDNRQAVKKY